MHEWSNFGNILQGWKIQWQQTNEKYNRIIFLKMHYQFKHN